MLFEYGYIPDGLCELRSQREIEKLMGFNVIDAECVAGHDESIIIVESKSEKEFLWKFVPEEKIVIFNELFRNKVSFMQKDLFQAWGRKRS